jgi:hypothetical protein
MNNIKNNYFISCIINSFEINLDSLCVNQYGNFGIQEAIKLFGYYHCKLIIKNLIHNILFYSSKKYSSNVICYLINYLKNNYFSKFLKVIKIIFNNKYICTNNINFNNKNNCKITLYQKLITNQYSIYIIFTIIQILIEIDEEYYKENIINSTVNIKKKYVNHNNKNFSSSSVNDKNENEDRFDDGKDEEKNEEINFINSIHKDNNIPFEEFEKLKKEVLLFIENNTQNKEKKKLINLMKLNKIENSFLTTKKRKSKNEI